MYKAVGDLETRVLTPIYQCHKDYFGMEQLEVVNFVALFGLMNLLTTIISSPFSLMDNCLVFVRAFHLSGSAMSVVFISN